MALPWLATLAKHVPWGELVRRTPDIIAASKRLLDKNSGGGSTDAKDIDAEASEEVLARRIAALENQQREQAELNPQVVEQIRGLTDVIEVLAARTRALMATVMTFAVVLFIIAVTLIVFVNK